MSKGPYAEAVDTFFDRAQEMLPTYVSRMPPMIMATGISAAVLFYLGIVAREVKQMGEKEGATISVKGVVLGKKPIEKGCPGTANMQKSGRGRGESSDDAHLLARMLHKVILRLEAFITYFRSCSNAMKIYFID